jgi:hypothetical protein
MWGALSDERTGLLFYNCCWTSPAQSFSGQSPVGLVTIFYCLSFETSLSVASYDSQSYGGGIRPCHHTEMQLGWCPSYKTHWHGPHRKHSFQEFIHCWVRSRCCGTCLFRGRYLVTGLHATILPSEKETTNLMQGVKAWKKAKVTSLSNNKFQWRTGDMPENVKEQNRTTMCSSRFCALQLEESTENAKLSSILVICQITM